MKTHEIIMITILGLVWGQLATIADAALMPADKTSASTSELFKEAREYEGLFLRDWFWGGSLISSKVGIKTVVFDEVLQAAGFVSDGSGTTTVILDEGIGGADFSEYAARNGEIGASRGGAASRFAFADLVGRKDLTQSPPPAVVSESDFASSSRGWSGWACSSGYIHLGIPSSLDHVYVAELDQLNNAGGWCDDAHLWDDYDLFYPTLSRGIDEVNGSADNSGELAGSLGTGTPVAVPEPATIILLGLGSIVFAANRQPKRRFQ